MTLRLSNWNISKDGNWYHKPTSAGQTSCSSFQNTLTASLDKLAPGTYSYTAYRDGQCTKAITAAHSFTKARNKVSVRACLKISMVEPAA